MVSWCSVGFADVQQQIIDQYLSNKKLDSIEGAWGTPQGDVMIFYKTQGAYRSVFIECNSNVVRCNKHHMVNKVGENYYTAERWAYKGEERGNRKNCKMVKPLITYSYQVSNNVLIMTVNTQGYLPRTDQNFRVWPSDIVAHNAQFKTKEDVAEEKQVIADMVNDAKKTCKVIGFEDGSEKFADCTLKLYTKKVDELVAEKVAADTRMMQSQTTTSTQSSGSNVMTIYDPVRDSRALMQQGQKMLSGGCTLGIDC